MNKFFIFILIFLTFSTAAFAKDLKFVQVTDSHLSNDGTTLSRRDVSNSVQTLKDAVNSINNISDVDFVVFSGDNIDSSSEENLKAFCKIIKKLNKPYYLALGDHDSYKIGGIGKNNYIKIVRQYNKYQTSSKPYYYFLPTADFIVIVMDGVTPMIPSPHGYYSEGSLNWLDSLLTKYKDKKAVIIQHFPLIAPYKNKNHDVLEPEKYLELLTRHENIFGIFSGHYHGGNKAIQDNRIYHVYTPALVESPYRYRVVEIDSKAHLKTKLIQLEK